MLLYMEEMGGGCGMCSLVITLLLKQLFLVQPVIFLRWSHFDMTNPVVASLQVVGHYLYFDAPNTAQLAKMFSHTTHQNI